MSDFNDSGKIRSLSIHKDAIEIKHTESNSNLNKQFLFAAVAAQLFGLACVGIIACLTAYYFKGFSWDNADKQFNYHPLLMTLGLIYLYGDAILVFRVFPSVQKLTVKIFHAIFHAGAIACTVIALIAVFEYHRKKKYEDLYSLHSWLGVATAGLFGVQYLAGFVTYLYPSLPRDWKEKILPFHTFFGRGIFVLALATALTGMTEKQIFSRMGGQSKQITETLGNTFGICLVIYGCLVIYLTSKMEFKRPAQTSEQASSNNVEVSVNSRL